MTRQPQQYQWLTSRTHPRTVEDGHSWEQITNTCPFNITHHPAISLPCGFGEGDRPIGLMLVGQH